MSKTMTTETLTPYVPTAQQREAIADAVRDAIREVFDPTRKFITDEDIQVAVQLPENDPGQWAPNSLVVVMTEDNDIPNVAVAPFESNNVGNVTTLDDWWQVDAIVQAKGFKIYNECICSVAHAFYPEDADM